jgi:formylglycine-generating enzyme required for sulfatase activity
MRREILACLVFAGIHLTAVPAVADYRLCNNARHSTFSALATDDKDKGFATFGWFEIKPMSCETVITGSLKGRSIYHFAEMGGISWWWPVKPEDRMLCVGREHQQSFAIFQSDVRGSCEAAGYGERRFRPVTNGTAENASWDMYWNAPLSTAEEKGMAPKEYFWECDGCPKMIVVPAGQFMMGSPSNEPGRHADESPQHIVTLRQPFAISERWVTRAEYEKFVEQTGHESGDKCRIWKDGKWSEEAGRSFRSPGFNQDGNNPVVCVNLDDAKAYIAWLSKQTGKTYRLPTESEWEYVIRAGTATPFWWGTTISTDLANYNGNLAYAGGAKGEFRQRTLFAGTKSNPWGLFGPGNAAEWVEDCWSATYQGATVDGSARSSGNCGVHAVRGGSWASDPASVRAAARTGVENAARINDVGFRVARPLVR